MEDAAKTVIKVMPENETRKLIEKNYLSPKTVKIA